MKVVPALEWAGTVLHSSLQSSLHYTTLHFTALCGVTLTYVVRRCLAAAQREEEGEEGQTQNRDLGKPHVTNFSLGSGDGVKAPGSK